MRGKGEDMDKQSLFGYKISGVSSTSTNHHEQEKETHI